MISMIEYNPTTSFELYAAAEMAHRGDIINLPSGDISVDRTIVVADGVSMVGRQNSRLISSTYILFDVTNSTDLTFQGFSIDQGGYAFRGEGGSNLSFNNIKFSGNTQTLNTSGPAFFLGKVSNVTVKFCDVIETFGGIYIYESNQVSIEDNDLERVAWGNIVVSGSTIRVAGNNIAYPGYFTASGAGNGDAITIGPTTGIIVEDNNVFNGFCYGVWATDGGSDFVFRGNTFSGGITSAIYLMNVSGGELENNVFSDNSYGISLISSRNIKIENNLFTRNQIWLDEQSSGVDLTSNHFYVTSNSGIAGSIIPITDWSGNTTNHPIQPLDNLPPTYTDTILAVPSGVVINVDIKTLGITDPNSDYFIVDLLNRSGSVDFRPDFLYTRGGAILNGILPSSQTSREFILKATDTSGAFIQGKLTLKAPDNQGIYHGTDSNDILRTLTSDQTLDGGKGNDTLFGAPGNDHLIGRAGDDTFWGLGGNDYIDGGDGDDVAVFDYSGQLAPLDINVHHISQSNSLISIENIRVIGSAGRDRILGGLSSDEIFGGDGNDDIDGDEGDDILHGELGHDFVFGGKGDDTLYGNEGDDILDGGDGDDILHAGDGEDILWASSGYDQLFGDNGNDVFRVKNINGVIDGGDGIDTVDYSAFESGITVSLPIDHGGSYNGHKLILHNIENIIGTDYSDLLIGMNGVNNQLNGGKGDDRILGLAGNDILIGSGGNDDLTGGTGSDIYRFHKGDGQDTLHSTFDFNPSKLNTLEFQDGIQPDDLILTLSNGDLVITLVNTSDMITIKDFFKNDDPSNADNDVQKIRFADGTEWDLTTITSSALVPTLDSDILIGTVANDIFSGLAGNDSLEGRGGNDTLNGDEGDDVLKGGKGNDILDGGLGDDTYLFNKDDGQDQINNNDPAPGHQDQIIFENDIAPSDIKIMRLNNDLKLINSTTDGSISILNYFDGQAASPNSITKIRFADDTQWDADFIVAHVAAPTSGEDILFGDTAADTISGGGGNDQIFGGKGNDTLYGDEGDDILDGGDGDDILQGGDGNDILWAASGYDQLFGDDGNDVFRVKNINGVIDGGDGIDTIDYSAFESGVTISLPINHGGSYNGHKLILHNIENIIGTDYSDLLVGMNGVSNQLDGGKGDDRILGLSSNDIITGGEGNDDLTGGTGNDIYRFSKGDGQDTIHSTFDSNSNKLNTLEFQDGIQPDDLILSQSDGDLVITLISTSDIITIKDFYKEDDPSNAYNDLQKMRFSDGTEWDLTTITARAVMPTLDSNILTGTVADDIISGLAGNDTLEGRGGNDTLNGDEGDDQIKGGKGNDILAGGLGNDTYLFDKGDGQDQINNSDPTLGRQDQIIFSSDIAPNDIKVMRLNDDLKLINSTTDDSISILNYFDGQATSPNSITKISFADGTQWDTDFIVAHVAAPTSGEDILFGDTAADTISGGGGNDQIFGGKGNDTLYGDEGDDILDGGDGDDILHGGDGNDILWVPSPSGYDQLFGDDGNDVFRVKNINGEIDGGNGVDTVDYSAFESGITVSLPIDHGGSYNGHKLILHNIENIIGTDYSDLLIGMNGVNNQLEGGKGDDRILALGGNDIIIGGEGNDDLTGGTGNDIYRFNKVDGQDTIYSTYDSNPSKLNTLEFQDGIQPDDLILTRINGDLVIRLIDTSDMITIKDFFKEDDPSNAYNDIQTIQFADGTEWDLALINSKINF